MQEKESIISVRYGWTNLSLGSLFGITRQSLVMPNNDPWDRFVHPYLTLMSDSYMLHPLESYEHLQHRDGDVSKITPLIIIKNVTYKSILNVEAQTRYVFVVFTMKSC